MQPTDLRGMRRKRNIKILKDLKTAIRLKLRTEIPLDDPFPKLPNWRYITSIVKKERVHDERKI